MFLLLKKELNILDSAEKILKYSYNNCKKIGIKKKYTLEEMDKFESLTSRFARLNDILIQKILRLIDTIDLENQGTVRDRINRAEKKELISKADDFFEIKILRNDIAHEYIPEAIKEIFKKVLKLTPLLFDSINKIKAYCKNYKK